MNKYEVKCQTTNSVVHNEWITIDFDSWKEAISTAWELKGNSNIINVVVREIHSIVFKGDADE